MSNFLFENIHPVYFKNLDSRRVGWSCIRKKSGDLFSRISPSHHSLEILYPQNHLYLQKKKHKQYMGGKYLFKNGEGNNFPQNMHPWKELQLRWARWAHILTRSPWIKVTVLVGFNSSSLFSLIQVGSKPCSEHSWKALTIPSTIDTILKTINLQNNSKFNLIKG